MGEWKKYNAEGYLVRELSGELFKALECYDLTKKEKERAMRYALEMVKSKKEIHLIQEAEI